MIDHIRNAVCLYLQELYEEFDGCPKSSSSVAPMARLDSLQ